MPLSPSLSLYASVGPDLTRYDVDLESGELVRRDSVSLPANVQYVWPHASRRFLYAATSNSASGMGPAGDRHHVTALAVDPATGALCRHGEPIALPTRPIHMATDVPSTHILVAFSNPSGLRVYAVNPDGTPGAEVTQAAPVDPGIFAHQVLATPDNRLVILVTRGHDAAPNKPEEPGALKVFAYADGQLSNEQSVAPGGGFGFGPRHLDFHPTQPWIYVALERQNELATFERHGDAIAPAAKYRTTALAEPGNLRGRQLVGTVHVHPNGRFVYVANRASSTAQMNGQHAFVGGENSIAVYAINSSTGEPTLIQHADTHGVHPRTFHIDPSGRLMAVAHIQGIRLADGTAIPPRLTTFRIGEDGRLSFLRAHDVDVPQGRFMWWTGMVAR
jgi:6-phosphogluconolactonase (cycloisomerase 2 family)